MFRIRSLASTALLASLVAGCDSPTTPEPLESDLLVQVRQAHGVGFDRVGEPDIGLFMATEQEFECLNHRIRALVEIDDETDVIDVEVFGVRRPDQCLAGAGAASFEALLAIEEGEYTLRVHSGDATDVWSLAVLEDRIVLEAQAQAFTHVPYPLFWNYPPGTFALLCHAPDVSSDAGCDALTDRLLEELEIEAYVFAAEGAIPYPVPADEGGESWRVAYFAYADAGVWNSAGPVVEDFAGARPDLLFYLMNWRNERHTSWAEE